MPIAPFVKSGLTIIQDFAAAAQSACRIVLDFTVGSVLLALAEAQGTVADWLQKLYLFALLISRLQTSRGQWVDSFCADFMPPVPGTDSPRLPSSLASGMLTFFRSTPQAQAIIPIATLSTTYDGKQVFQVIADTSNAAYSATIIPGGGYIVAAGVASLDVPAQSLTPGAPGNVLANSITLLRSSLVGIDGVNNAAAFATGLDAEADDALKSRFKLFILSLRAGTPDAIAFVIASLQQGLQQRIHQNVLPNGATSYGSFTVYVDDGTGAISSALVQAANVAVNTIYAAGTRPNVIAATKLGVNIVLTLGIADGYDRNVVIAAVENAVGAYVQNLQLEQTLRFTMIEHVAYNASAGVTNVSGVTANGGTADIVPAMGQTIKLGNTGVVVS